jgi:hypothetical protein
MDEHLRRAIVSKLFSRNGPDFRHCPVEMTESAETKILRRPRRKSRSDPAANN